MRKECQPLGRGGFEVLLEMGMERVVREEGASSAKVPGWENVENRRKKILPTPTPCFVFAPFLPALKIDTLIYSLLCAGPQV